MSEITFDIVNGIPFPKRDSLPPDSEGGFGWLYTAFKAVGDRIIKFSKDPNVNSDAGIIHAGVLYANRSTTPLLESIGGGILTCVAEVVLTASTSVTRTFSVPFVVSDYGVNTSLDWRNEYDGSYMSNTTVYRNVDAYNYINMQLIGGKLYLGECRIGNVVPAKASITIRYTSLAGVINPDNPCCS